MGTGILRRMFNKAENSGGENKRKFGKWRQEKKKEKRKKPEQIQMKIESNIRGERIGEERVSWHFGKVNEGPSHCRSK